MDYAVVVDMARNMASGTDFPIFFYGQAYMGSLEPAVSALLCFLFGPSPFCVCLGTAILGIVTLFVTMQLGKRLAGEWGGILSLLLAITGSFHWVHFMVSPRGGYALASLLTVSSLALASIGSFLDDDDGKTRIYPAALFGLMAGLAFWNFWIALPAFAAAGIILLVRLRLRLFAPRFILPCLASFFIGSSPWWAWTIKNGLGALDTQGSGPRPLGMRAIYNLFSIVIPRFYGTSPTPPDFWRSMLPWTLAALLLVSAAAILAGSNKALKTSFWAAAIYTGFFALAYANSSFGSMGVARYLVPFVPVFSVLCGSALGSLLETGPSQANRQRRSKAFGIATVAVALVFYALGGAVPSVRTSIASLKSLKEKGMQWKESVEAVEKDPSLSQAAFADFSLFGYNWASDRRVCLASPSRWRYTPYLMQLEEAATPAVINNFHSFSTFCGASGGTCRNRRVGSLRISDNITPPPETGELPDTEQIHIRLADGSEVGHLLLDDNLASCVRMHGTATQEPFLNVDFPAASGIGGVSILMDSIDCARGWRVDFKDENGGISPGVADDPHQGWFWSGPRPYQFGPEARWTIRWPSEKKASGIRITFTSRWPRAPISISDLRLLTHKPLAPLDVEAVKRAVADAQLSAPEIAIHSGRWLGRQIGAKADPSLLFGSAADNLGVPGVCRSVTIDLASPNLFVFRDPNIASAATQTLSSFNVDYESKEVGGCTLMSTHPLEAIATDSQPLRFFGGRIMRDAPPPLDTRRFEPRDIDFGGLISLSGTSHLPKTIRPGEKIIIDMLWQWSQNSSAKGSIHIFIHAIQNDKIAFQAGASINPGKSRRPADKPHPAPLTLQMDIPEDIAAGKVSFAICVKKDYPFAPRIAPTGNDIEVTSRRVVLGHTTVVKE